jgi:hypothetical protein
MLKCEQNSAFDPTKLSGLVQLGVSFQLKQTPRLIGRVFLGFHGDLMSMRWVSKVPLSFETKGRAPTVLFRWKGSFGELKEMR